MFKIASFARPACPTFSTAALLAASLLAAPLLPAAGADAQGLVAEAPPLETLFDAAPAGAEVVWAVPSLRGFSDRIANFAANTGLDRHAPELLDALDAFKQEMDLHEGIDDEGPLLVALSGLGTALGAQLDDDPNNDDIVPMAVMLVPVSDYAAFITSLGGDPEADIADVLINHEEGFARHINGYAAIAPTLEAAEAYAPGDAGDEMVDATGELAADYFSQGQLLMYVDVKALAPSLKPAIARAVDEIQNEMGHGNDPMERALPALMNGYATLANGLIDGTDTFVYAIDLAEAGLSITLGGQLIEGSTFAGMFKPANLVNDDAPADNAADAPADEDANLLRRLPDQAHLFAAGVDLTRFDLDAFLAATQELAANLGQMANEEDNLPIKQIVALYTDMLNVAPDATAMASVMYAPEPAAMMGGGFFNQLSVTATPDAQGTLKRQKEVMAKLNDLVIPMSADDDEAGEALSFETTYTEKALEIDGTQVDQYQVKTVFPPSLVKEMGPAGMVMGGSGTGGYLAATKNHVLVTTVTDPQLVTRGLKALDAEDGLGSDITLTQLRDTHLPADPSVEAYVSVSGIANTVNPFLMMFAPGGEQVNVPADLPPVGLGGSSDGDSVVLRLFMPADVFKFGVDTFEQFAPEEQDAPQPRGRRAPRAI